MSGGEPDRRQGKPRCGYEKPLAYAIDLHAPEKLLDLSHIFPIQSGILNCLWYFTP